MTALLRSVIKSNLAEWDWLTFGQHALLFVKHQFEQWVFCLLGESSAVWGLHRKPTTDRREAIKWHSFSPMNILLAGQIGSQGQNNNLPCHEAHNGTILQASINVSNKLVTWSSNTVLKRWCRTTQHPVLAKAAEILKKHDRLYEAQL